MPVVPELVQLPRDEFLTLLAHSPASLIGVHSEDASQPGKKGLLALFSDRSRSDGLAGKVLCEISPRLITGVWRADNFGWH